MSTSTATAAPPCDGQNQPFTRPGKQPYPRSGGQKQSDAPRPEPRILFQKYFKSVGPRTYAAQVKEASNGNHFIVLTESKRDDKSDQPRMTRLFVFSEDFAEFFKLVQDTAEFVTSHPVADAVKRKRGEFWSRQNAPEKQADRR